MRCTLLPCALRPCCAPQVVSLPPEPLRAAARPASLTHSGATLGQDDEQRIASGDVTGNARTSICEPIDDLRVLDVASSLMTLISIRLRGLLLPAHPCLQPLRGRGQPPQFAPRPARHLHDADFDKSYAACQARRRLSVHQQVSLRLQLRLYAFIVLALQL